MAKCYNYLRQFVGIDRYVCMLFVPSSSHRRSICLQLKSIHNCQRMFRLQRRQYAYCYDCMLVPQSSEGEVVPSSQALQTPRQAMLEHPLRLMFHARQVSVSQRHAHQLFSHNWAPFQVKVTRCSDTQRGNAGAGNKLGLIVGMPTNATTTIFIQVY